MDLGHAMFAALMTAAAGILGALLTALFARASIRHEAARAYGELTQRVDEHGRRLDHLTEDGRLQWEHISQNEVQIANLRGRHKLNGGT